MGLRLRLTVLFLLQSSCRGERGCWRGVEAGFAQEARDCRCQRARGTRRHKLRAIKQPARRIQLSVLPPDELATGWRRSRAASPSASARLTGDLPCLCQPTLCSCQRPRPQLTARQCKNRRAPHAAACTQKASTAGSARLSSTQLRRVPLRSSASRSWRVRLRRSSFSCAAGQQGGLFSPTRPCSKQHSAGGSGSATKDLPTLAHLQGLPLLALPCFGPPLVVLDGFGHPAQGRPCSVSQRLRQSGCCTLAPPLPAHAPCHTASPPPPACAVLSLLSLACAAPAPPRAGLNNPSRSRPRRSGRGPGRGAATTSPSAASACGGAGAWAQARQFGQRRRRCAGREMV